MTNTIRDAAAAFELEYGTRAHCVLACAGGSDEHWQLFHPEHMEMPMWVFWEGELLEHPDAPEV